MCRMCVSFVLVYSKKKIVYNSEQNMKKVTTPLIRKPIRIYIYIDTHTPALWMMLCLKPDEKEKKYILKHPLHL